MSLAICPECRQKVSDKSSKCPFCGAPFSNAVRNTQINWIVGIVLTLMLLSLVWFFYDLQKKSAKIDKKNEEVAKSRSERRGMWTDDPLTISNRLDELYRQGTINKSFYDKAQQQLMEPINEKLRRKREGTNSEKLDRLEELLMQIYEFENP